MEEGPHLLTTGQAGALEYLLELSGPILWSGLRAFSRAARRPATATPVERYTPYTLHIQVVKGFPRRDVTPGVAIIAESTQMFRR